VVPSSIVGYFAATAAAAGALIGLRFVTVSLHPDLIFGDQAAPRARRLAESSFIGLVNTFFLSLVALIPHTDIGYPAAILAALSFYTTLTRHLRKEKTSQLTVLLSTFAIYLSGVRTRHRRYHRSVECQSRVPARLRGDRGAERRPFSSLGTARRARHEAIPALLATRARFSPPVLGSVVTIELLAC
jgi:hypothetical protein